MSKSTVHVIAVLYRLSTGWGTVVVVSVDHPEKIVAQRSKLALQKAADQWTTRREPLEEREPSEKQMQHPGGPIALWYLSLDRRLSHLLRLRRNAMTPDQIRQPAGSETTEIVAVTAVGPVAAPNLQCGLKTHGKSLSRRDNSLSPQSTSGFLPPGN